MQFLQPENAVFFDFFLYFPRMGAIFHAFLTDFSGFAWKMDTKKPAPVLCGRQQG